MEKQASIDELEAIQRQLMDSTHVLQTVSHSKENVLQQKIDPDFLESLVGETGLLPQTRVFSDKSFTILDHIFKQTEEGKKEQLLSSIDLYTRVKEHKNEAVWTGPYNITKAIFPIKLSKQILHCIATGPLKIGPVTQDEIQLLSKATNIPGSTIQTEIEKIPYYSEEDIACIFNMYRNYTRALENALAYHLRTRDLTEQVVQAERTRSLGTLSSGISHHFNGLLSIILGYSSYILKRNDLPEECTTALQQITEAAERGRSLTEELLCFAGTEMEEEAISHVHDTLQNVISLLETEKSGKQRIETRFNATEDTVKALPSDIHQMVFNFLTITIDEFSNRAHVTVQTDNIHLDADPNSQEYLRIEVLGPDSVPQTITSQDDFSILENSQPEMRLSSLIGLVQRIDGTVIVSPEDNKTPQIVVLLPISRKFDPPLSEIEVKSCVPASNIWIVDDDPLFRDMCVQVLKEEGHEVSEHPDGTHMKEAWIATKQKPDLIVIDFSMPDYNGRELREWLNTQGAIIPVVMVSGLAPNQPDIKKALKLKKTYFLQKPFSYRELSNIVSIARGENLIGE